MGLFSNTKDENNLLRITDFSQEYDMVTKSTFMMGKENPPLTMESASKIRMEQKTMHEHIITDITVLSAELNADHILFKQSFPILQALTEISPKIIFKRNMFGETIQIENIKEMWEEWEKWKSSKLKDTVSDITKQRKFCNNYERGLKVLQESLHTNLQYLLLLPSCYQFKNYLSSEATDKTMHYQSRLVDELELAYKLIKQKTKKKDDDIELSLVNDMVGYQYRLKQVKEFYANNFPNYSYEEYRHSIKIGYEFANGTTLINKGHLDFKESIHENYYYQTEIQLILSKE